MTSGHNMITSSITLNLNTWYYIVLTYKKGVGMTLYVNGEVVATKTPSESSTLNYNIQPSGTINPLYIGWFDYFKGVIDEVRIYPRSLSISQIQQRYNETKTGQTNSSTIVQAELKTGETWYCKVTPNDSHIDGETKTSNQIIIGQNNKPMAKDLKITPATPNTTDNLTAAYTYFDPDGDPENTTLTEIRWYRNGILVPELNSTLTVPSSFTSKGEVWYFTVRPSDGKEYGDIYQSPSVLIQNSPPTINSYYPLNDPTIKLGEPQDFNITCTDPDGDTLIIKWYINGTLKEEWNGYTSVTFLPDQAGVYTITVVVSDGQKPASHDWLLTVEEQS
jgi:membrane carboxypeptidase/penicillin-binding protein PbpC